MNPAMYGRPQGFLKRWPGNSSIALCGDSNEDFQSEEFGSPWEINSRDPSYWNYEKDCFRVDRNQFETNEFSSSSPDNFFTADSWRQREEQKKQPLSPGIPYEDPLSKLKVKGRSVGADEDKYDDLLDADKRARGSQVGKLCGTQNYYKLDPAECDADYASLCISGQKAGTKSTMNEDTGMGIATSIVVGGEREFLFSFGKCGRVAVMTPITEVSSQCGTPYRILLSPSLSEESLSPVSSISCESAHNRHLARRDFHSCDQYIKHYSTPRGRVSYKLEVHSSSQLEKDSVYDYQGRLKKSVSAVTSKDPLVDQLERLSILPERTRAAYNLPKTPVTEFGIPGLSVSTATLTNRYSIKKIEDRPLNMFAYKSLPPLYPTYHLDKSARAAMNRSKSVYGLKYNTGKSRENSNVDVSKDTKDNQTENGQSRCTPRRKSESDLKSLRARLPPLRKSSKRKTSKTTMKKTTESKRSKKRSRDMKSANDYPSPWQNSPRDISVSSEIETVIGEKLEHSFDPMEPEPEPDGNLQSSSLILMRSGANSTKSKTNCPYMSQSVSKGSIAKKAKRKRGIKNRKKNERNAKND